MAAKTRRGVIDAQEAANTRLNVRISPEAHRRLGIHSVMTGMAPGKLVEKLIEEHLREFRVQAIRGDQARSSDRLESAAHVSQVSLPVGL